MNFWDAVVWLGAFLLVASIVKGPSNESIKTTIGMSMLLIIDELEAGRISYDEARDASKELISGEYKQKVKHK